MDFMSTNTLHMRDFDADDDISDDLKPGEWMGLVVESQDLTIPTGESPSMSIGIDLGGRMKRIDLPLIDFVDINNQMMGFPTWDITTDTPNDLLKFCIIIPFSYEDAINAIDIEADEQFGFTYRHGNANGGNVTIAGLVGENIAEAYLPIIGKIPRTGAGRITLNIPEKNVYCILVKPRANTDIIYLFKDGKLLNDGYAIENIGVTQIVKKIEAGVQTKAFFDLAPAKVIESLMTDDVSVKVDHGPNDGTSYAWYIAFEFISRRREKSASKQLTIIDAKSTEIIKSRPDMGRIIHPVITPLPVRRLPARRGYPAEALR